MIAGGAEHGGFRGRGVDRRRVKRRRHRKCCRSCALLVIFAALSIFVRGVNGHAYHVDHTDEELALMDTESLLHVEHDLRKQNKLVDKHVASLHGRLHHVEDKQKQLEKEFKKLESGRDWEGRQKLNKEKELGMAKAEMETKRDQMATISAHADEVRAQIRELEAKMQALNLEKQADEIRFANPTILDVVDAKVELLSPTARSVYNKTLHTLIFPGLSTGAAGAEQLRRHMRSSTHHVAVASTFIIYAFVVCLCALVFRAYRQIVGHVTLTKIIFTCDMCFSGFWFFVCMWGVGLLDDPLMVMRRHNEPILIALQLTVGCAVLGYVAIRCISVAASLRGRESVELIVALFIVQHFFYAIWAPSLTDGETTDGVGSYLAYAVGHLLLAARRARSQVYGDVTYAKGGVVDGDGEFDEGEESNLLWWFVGQMKNVALLVEAILFTVASKSVAEEGDDGIGEERMDRSSSRRIRSRSRHRRKGKKGKDAAHCPVAMREGRPRRI